MKKNERHFILYKQGSNYNLSNKLKNEKTAEYQSQNFDFVYKLIYIHQNSAQFLMELGHQNVLMRHS